MNEMQIFTNELFGSIRILEENDGKVLFCGSDVAKALGYADTQKAIKTHCKKDGWVIRPVIDSMGRTQDAKFITEGNLYRLITHSKLPDAEKFESWVFDEILPSIWKHGLSDRQRTGTGVDESGLFNPACHRTEDRKRKTPATGTAGRGKQAKSDFCGQRGGKQEQHSGQRVCKNLQAKWH